MDQAERLLQANEILQQYGLSNPLDTAPTQTTSSLNQAQQQLQSSVPTEPPKPMMEAIVDTVAPYVPMTAEMGTVLYGATKGAEMLKPFGKQAQTAGMFLFGAGGAVMGEQFRQLLQGENDPVAALNKGLESGLFFGAGEAIGQTVRLAVQGATALRSGVQPSADQVAALGMLQQELKAYGLEKQIKNLTLTPAQILGQGFEQTLEAVGKAGFGGDARFNKLYEGQANFVIDRMKGLINGLTGKSRQDIGKAYQQAILDADETLKNWAKPIYAEMDEAGRNAPVILAETTKELEKRIKIGLAGRRKGAASRLDPKVEDVYRFVLGERKNSNFTNTFDTISRLSADLRTAQNATDRNMPYEKALRDVRELLQKDLETAAKSRGNEDLLKKWTQTNETYKKSLETLYESSISGLAKEAPEFVGSKLAKQGNVTAVENAFKAIDESVRLGARSADEGLQLKRDLQGGYLRELLTSVETKEQTVGALAQLNRQIKANAEAGDTFKTILDPQQRAKVVRFLGYADHLEKTSSGAFSLVVRGRQAGSLNQAIGNITTGTATAGVFVDPTIFVGSLAILTTPTFLAKRALNPKTADAFLEKLKPIVKRAQQDGYQLTKSDFLAVTSMLASSLDSVGDELPVEMMVKGLTPRQSVEYQVHRANIIAQTGQDIGILPN